jgi:hypothetical protein
VGRGTDPEKFIQLCSFKYVHRNYSGIDIIMGMRSADAGDYNSRKSIMKIHWKSPVSLKMQD